MNIRTSIIACMAMGLLGGCEQPTATVVDPKTPPRPVADVREVILEVNPPVPLNLDDHPGPDGVRVRIYFVAQGDLPVTVSGGLDMLLYELDFPKSRDESMASQPFKTWTFTPAEVDGAMGRTIIGWGYELPLLWGKDVPRSSKIILRARYRSPSGQVVMSAPVTIEMTSN